MSVETSSIHLSVYLISIMRPASSTKGKFLKLSPTVQIADCQKDPIIRTGSYRLRRWLQYLRNVMDINASYIMLSNFKSY